VMIYSTGTNVGNNLAMLALVPGCIEESALIVTVPNRQERAGGWAHVPCLLDLCASFAHALDRSSRIEIYQA